MFVDQIKIFARAGKGGDGSVHFRREKYIPRGGPDGGDGGNGGDIIFEVDPHTDNLRDFFYRPKLLAQSGAGGAGARKTGRSGKSFVAKVPAGTLIYRIPPPAHAAFVAPESLKDAPAEEFLVEDDVEMEALEETFENEQHSSGSRPDGELVADLTQLGERYVLCRGGKGGKGNSNFKSSINRVPREFTPGEQGEEGWYHLELRRIADAGFVGFPNAGKSTLLTLLSEARPKIGNYPFTTLQPMVGVLQFEGFRRATIADIPGLIEGAHRNVGLGHDFLRHIMRCRLLLFVVDIAGSEGRDPVEDIRTLRKEISLHDDLLAKYPWLIIANKTDLPEAKNNIKRVKRAFPKIEVIPISGHTGDGIEPLRVRLDELIAQHADY